jgi:hypothetical protein
MAEHLRICMAVAALTIVACAPVGTGDVREQLDERTGVTVTSMSAPLEFFSPQPERGLQAASFASLGPVEINRMGQRQTYLWLSVLCGEDKRERNSAGMRAELKLRIFAADTTLEPAFVTTDARQIELEQRVYERPADWIEEAFYAISAAQLAELAAADSLLLELSAADEESRRYELWKSNLAGLRDFVQRIGATAAQ